MKISYHPLYTVFDGMKQRCYNPNHNGYHNYGGRGIIICDDWKNNPKNFIEWYLNNGWKKGLQIDRYPDKNGNYTPNNCRFITHKENNNNKRTNRQVKYKNQIKNISQWAKEYKICRHVLKRRLDLGWSIEIALTKKIRYKVKNGQAK